MLKEEISKLSSFTTFLYNQIESYRTYDLIIEELKKIANERKEVRERKTFAQSKRYAEIQEIIKAKYSIVYNGINEPIKAKIKDIYRDVIIDNVNFFVIINNAISIKDEELDLLKESISKYREYREKTNKYFFDTLFNDFDEEMNILSEYFLEVPCYKSSSLYSIQILKDSPLFDNEKNCYLDSNGRIILSLDTEFSSFWFWFNLTKSNFSLSSQKELLRLKAFDYLELKHYIILLNRFLLTVPEQYKNGVEWFDLQEWVKNEILEAQSTASSNEVQTTAKYPVIDTDKYNSDLIYEKFVKNGLLFKCTKEVFNSWFVNGVGHIERPKLNKDVIAYIGQTKLLIDLMTSTNGAKVKYFREVFNETIEPRHYQKTIFSYTNELKACEVK